MPPAVEEDKATNGGEVAVFGAEAEMFEPEDGADVFQKSVRVARVCAVGGVCIVGVVHAGSFLERFSSMRLLFFLVSLV